MKLGLTNIGKTKNTSINIDSITVIAGENNTGKSTVGKSLFSIFNSLYDYQDIIIKDKKDNIYELIMEYVRNRYITNDRMSFFRLIETLAEDIKQEINLLVERSESRPIIDSIDEKIMEYFEDEEKHTVSEENKEEAINRLSKSINDIINVSNDDILKKIISNNLRDEFNGQINNIYKSDIDEIGSIKLEIKGSTSEILIKEDSVIEVINPQVLKTRAVYLDDPNVIDNPRFVRPRNRRGNFNHRDYLNELLLTDINNGSKENLTKQVLADQKLEDIFNKLNPIVPGRIIRQRFDIGYQESDVPNNLNIRNLSSGMKTFVILKTLLTNGALEENGTIILDEPEIHLHPEWQLVLAELIVLVQKEFNMHILLTTHSPYFLYAIEVFAERHGILQTTKFYISKSRESTFDFEDITDNVEAIYAQLAEPFQNLENIRYE